jgi:flagellar motor protein MotB
MRRRSRNHELNNEELNIWPAFTDLMSNAFMILNLFLLITLMRSLFFKSTADTIEKNLTQVQEELKKSQAIVNTLNTDLANRKKELQTKKNDITQLKGEIKRLKSPPLIVIKDSDKDPQGRPLRFDTGRADLPEGLRLFIEDNVVNQLDNFAKEYQGYIVDVIGHTDGQATAAPASNIDQTLENVAKGNESVSNLNAGSNADLGLMRALAVVKKLQEIQGEKRLGGLKFRAYSAAQLYLPSGDYASVNRNADESRRRIEIRFTPPAVER